jgi:TrmH family RNA methyltransferase
MITSKSNAIIKSIRKLHARKYRELNNLFYIEGVRILAEALASDWEINEIIVAPDLVRNDFSIELLACAKQKKIPIIEVDEHVFKSISLKEGPKGLAAVVIRKWSPLRTIAEKKGLWVALDRIQDPGNLGTIMRTAESVSAKGIILIDNCTDPFDIASVRSSMGALFSMSIIKAESDEFINFVKNSYYTLIGTSDKGAVDYRELDYDKNSILLMGSEREGLSSNLISACDHLVFIPMSGSSDSLNLAIATAVCLFEIQNQFHPIP